MCAVLTWSIQLLSKIRRGLDLEFIAIIAQSCSQAWLRQPNVVSHMKISNSRLCKFTLCSLRLHLLVLFFCVFLQINQYQNFDKTLIMQSCLPQTTQHMDITNENQTKTQSWTKNNCTTATRLAYVINVI